MIFVNECPNLNTVATAKGYVVCTLPTLIRGNWLYSLYWNLRYGLTSVHGNQDNTNFTTAVIRNDKKIVSLFKKVLLCPRLLYKIVFSLKKKVLLCSRLLYNFQQLLFYFGSRYFREVIHLFRIDWVQFLTSSYD